MMILETPRLLLREFVPEDADAMARIISDPETMRYYPAPFELKMPSRVRIKTACHKSTKPTRERRLINNSFFLVSIFINN